MDRGAWQATVHGVAKSQTGLSDFHLFCLKQMSNYESQNYLQDCCVLSSGLRKPQRSRLFLLGKEKQKKKKKGCRKFLVSIVFSLVGFVCVFWKSLHIRK